MAAFTRDTWSDRGSSDYLADAYPQWIEGDDKRTLVAEADGTVVGLAQGVLLSEHEAWGQGLRVHPEYRKRGISRRLTEALFDWAAGEGATVFRVMVFSWNVAGLGQARSTGYEPVTEFRWATPEPDPDAEPELRIVSDPDVAWRAWQGSDARDHLRGLALDADESWAVSELTRADLRRAADERSVLAVADERARAMAVRVRDYERDGEDDGTDHRVEYGVGAWTDFDALDSLLAAVRRDAAAFGADSTRLLIPETVEHVSDVAAAGTPIADDPDFVLAADLTDR